MKVKDYNSNVNQRIKGKFIQREVLTCFSYEIDELLKKEVLSYDDIDNLYLDPEKYYKDYGYETAEEYEESGENYQEPYEWWIVTEWLWKKLRDKNEPVLEWGNNYYWGRTCTGQAILLDNVISEITSEMKILEGQRNDWSKYLK